jgi:maltose O-acetyltransferase
MILGNRMNKFLDRLRYDWPLHIVVLLTDWFPDNIVFYRIRGMLARPFFGSCGANFRMNRHIEFLNASSIKIGKDVFIAVGCVFLAVGDIQIGDEVMFGPYVVVSAGKHTKLKGSYRYGLQEKAPITIGSGTWIGAHTTVAGGAKIGSGCVIGCNAAVTRGIIPDNSFAGGVPAVIKSIDQEAFLESPNIVGC